MILPLFVVSTASEQNLFQVQCQDQGVVRGKSSSGHMCPQSRSNISRYDVPSFSYYRLLVIRL